MEKRYRLAGLTFLIALILQYLIQIYSIANKAYHCFSIKRIQRLVCHMEKTISQHV